MSAPSRLHPRLHWAHIVSISDFDRLLEVESGSEKPIFIFKHSIHCSISAVAKFRLEASWDKYFSDVPVFLVDLIRHRELSNYIAEKLNVRHESPQVIVVKNGLVIFDDSHLSISAKRLSELN